MERHLSVLISGLLFILPASGQQVPAEPWKWSLEQRIAARFDERARATHVREAASRSAQFQGSHATNLDVAPSPLSSDVLDFNTHPELFFPTEIFEHFVWSVYTHDSPVWRQAIMRRSDDILRTDAEWRDLDAIVAPYVKNLKRDLGLMNGLGTAAMAKRRDMARERENLQGDLCSSERAALRGARARFGADRFNRFLYTVSIRGFSSSYVYGNDFERDRARLIATEENCQ